MSKMKTSRKNGGKTKGPCSVKDKHNLDKPLPCRGKNDPGYQNALKNYQKKLAGFSKAGTKQDDVNIAKTEAVKRFKAKQDYTRVPGYGTKVVYIEGQGFITNPTEAQKAKSVKRRGNF